MGAHEVVGLGAHTRLTQAPKGTRSSLLQAATTTPRTALTMEPPQKRARTVVKNTNDPGSHRCHLTRMPLELLAEILSYTLSPRDVLALARTGKHFCTILVNNKSTEFIWRQARARAHMNRIPDPTPNFTEASYASFLFDSKRCEVLQLEEPIYTSSTDLL